GTAPRSARRSASRSSEGPPREVDEDVLQAGLAEVDAVEGRPEGLQRLDDGADQRRSLPGHEEPEVSRPGGRGGDAGGSRRASGAGPALAAPERGHAGQGRGPSRRRRDDVEAGGGDE